MGVLQALEAIKLIARGDLEPRNSDIEMSESPNTAPPSLLIFSAYGSQPFRSMRMRSRRKDCAACSSTASITRESLTSGSLDYVAFCGVTNPVNILSEDERIGAKTLAEAQKTNGNIILIDVRDATQFELSNISGSINVPWADFPMVVNQEQQPDWLRARDIAVICRLGNDSQLAVKMIKNSRNAAGNVVDVKGGFRAWKAEVDPTWPDY